MEFILTGECTTWITIVAVTWDWNILFPLVHLNHFIIKFPQNMDSFYQTHEIGSFLTQTSWSKWAHSFSQKNIKKTNQISRRIGLFVVFDRYFHCLLVKKGRDEGEDSWMEGKGERGMEGGRVIGSSPSPLLPFPPLPLHPLTDGVCEGGTNVLSFQLKMRMWDIENSQERQGRRQHICCAFPN